ncbi:BTAD domain-containing putative transcriptional regulator [Actinoplanes sp. CA-030573]|uniref:AfsR/SARP family transcriptional regulator n=1 Tax=Actinoplanes sp. CA-030573 TaxID=3239898 RepID=UPI003D9033D9
MRFHVLGAIEARHEGAEVALGPPKQRLLLAVLICHRGEALTADRLVDILWPARPPASARENLRGYVHGLRAALGPDLLTRRGGSYALTAAGEQIDAGEFAATVARADPADPAAAREMLASALSLWRGPAYQEFGDVPVLAAEAARLDDLRLLATELRIEADLAVGRAAEVVRELGDLVGRYPYRERFCALLLLALYRSGRQAEALALYRRTRQRLVDELGVEPQPELRDLHRAILGGDRRLLAPPAAAARPARPVPAQLPADVEGFAGRGRELAALTAAATGPGRTVVVSAIGGTGGIGKTWLALHWAHRHRDRFPDGQLFVNLRGFDPSGQQVSTETAVRGFLDALGVPPDAVPADLPAQVGLYRSLVADRRMLVLLDNARDTGQVVDLLPGTPACVTVVTSRDQLVGLVAGHGARPLPVDVLAPGEAHDLLRRRVAAGRLAAEPNAVRRLVGYCSGLPLALGVIAARAALRPHEPLTVIADELGRAGDRLSALDEDGSYGSLRAVLSWSYTALPPTAARMFALLGLVPGPDVGTAAAAALAGLPVARAERLLRTLLRQSMVGEPAPGRWRMHDLVRLYAAECAAAGLPAEERRQAARRLVDHYLAHTHAAELELNARRRCIGLDAAPVAAFPDLDSAMTWLTTEHASILAVQRLAAETGWDRATWQLAWSLSSFHRRTGRAHDEIVSWQLGRSAAAADGDLAAMGDAERGLGGAYGMVGNLDLAIGHLERALALGVRSGDRDDQARSHRTLALAYLHGGDVRRGLDHAHRALRIYQKWGAGRRTLADALNTAGYLAAKAGEIPTARTHLTEALSLCRRVGSRDTELATLDSLGYVEFLAGRPADALRHYRRALPTSEETGHHFLRAELWEHIGDAHAALGEPGQAQKAWRRAMDLYVDQGRHRDAESLRAKVRG